MEEISMQLGALIEGGFELFTFNYPFYDEKRRKEFEQSFIDKFYFSEIGLETPSRFRHALATKMNLIMPYYNKIFETQELEQRILDNYDVTETYKRDIKNNSKSTNESTNKNLYASTPKNKKTDINNVDYVDNITKDIENNINNITGDTVENWERKMQGNIGVATDADAIKSYWTSLRRVEEEIFTELDELFMGVF